MSIRRISESELVLNADKSVYHLHLRDEHVAPIVLMVGDPERVHIVSSYLDTIDFKIANREFVCHTGSLGSLRITVISTGIGTDNLDIVINELDAAVNIDPETRTIKSEKRQLQLIRLGTTGALHSDIDLDALIVSEYAIGFDGLMYYYDIEMTKEEQSLQADLIDHLKWHQKLSEPYLIQGCTPLIANIGKDMIHGITATTTGFYGPQGRAIRLGLRRTDINEKMMSFQKEDRRITNFEMETSGLYLLGRALGHQCCSISVVLANRANLVYSNNNALAVKNMIESVLLGLNTLL